MRDKLVELIQHEVVPYFAERIADHLIANGVTITPESLRAKGEWVELTECANEGVYCSVCHKKVYKLDYAWAAKRNKVRSNFCPNCGADMKGEADATC